MGGFFYTILRNSAVWFQNNCYLILNVLQASLDTCAEAQCSKKKAVLLLEESISFPCQRLTAMLECTLSDFWWCSVSPLKKTLQHLQEPN